MKKNYKENLLTVKEIQEVYLELMVEFDAICEKYGLRYDLCGGSLLGAVRHEGFIPWDNDIDIAMPRHDYEKLLSMKLDGTLIVPDEREVVSNRDKTFPRHFARYIRKDVGRVPRIKTENDCPFVGLDIFVSDGLPSSWIAFKWQIWRIKQVRRFLHTSLEKNGTSRRGKFAAFIKDLYRPLLKKIGCFRLANKLDYLCALYNYDTADYVGNISGMYGLKERWLKVDMLPQKKFKFEGHYFWGYANYDIYLRNLYGDYMQLPPEEKRVPHCADACWLNKR